MSVDEIEMALKEEQLEQEDRTVMTSNNEQLHLHTFLRCDPPVVECNTEDERNEELNRKAL